MRCEPATVGRVADGTDTLEPVPATDQDASVPRRAQVCETFALAPDGAAPRTLAITTAGPATATPSAARSGRRRARASSDTEPPARRRTRAAPERGARLLARRYPCPRGRPSRGAGTAVAPGDTSHRPTARPRATPGSERDRRCGPRGRPRGRRGGGAEATPALRSPAAASGCRPRPDPVRRPRRPAPATAPRASPGSTASRAASRV